MSQTKTNIRHYILLNEFNIRYNDLLCRSVSCIYITKATHILVWNYKGKGDAQDGGNYKGLKGDAMDRDTFRA